MFGIGEIAGKVGLEWLWGKVKDIANAEVRAEAERRVAELERLLEERARALDSIDGVMKALRENEQSLWASRPPVQPFKNYNERVARLMATASGKRRPFIVTLMNFKGGVGKTTTVANLAYYFAHSCSKRVLLVDLDYQGSLTTVLRRSSGVVDRTDASTLIDHSDTETPLQALYKSRLQLKTPLQNVHLIPAFYGLARQEERIMIEWLLNKTSDDVRYRLASALLSDEISDQYDVILIDAAPRLTTGTVNAICASTHILVPTIFTTVSAEPVANFLATTMNLASVLNPKLQIMGIVETMAPYADKVDDRGMAARSEMEGLIRQRGLIAPVFAAKIPRKADLTDGDVCTKTDVTGHFKAVGDELIRKSGGLP